MQGPPTAADAPRAFSCDEDIFYGHSDTLLARVRFGANNRGHPWESYVKKLKLFTSGPQAAIVVLNAGAHIYGEGNFTHVLNATRRTRAQLFPELPLIWMTGPAAGCGEAPLTAAPESAFWAAHDASGQHVFANWPAFAARDAVARAFWEQDKDAGGKDERVSVLTMSPLHRRVDAHPSGGDCLHVCEPVLSLSVELLHHHLWMTPGLRPR